ncbi:TIGR01548 family HAD-type hydrolase [candidate division KSB1 bacterium]|nr:TIGR01548 family HAD-type hydrolase [candidate division KSB1 bacterium]
MKVDAVLFDMDGVLVDVSRSYRLAIKETAEFFTGQEVNFSEISAFKQKGGYNNDWKLTEDLVRSRGIEISSKDVIDKFQSYYLGNNFDGFLLNEQWLIKPDILEKISSNYKTGIVTGRPRTEAEFVLRRFSVQAHFNALVAMEDTPPERGKPAPDGIFKIMKELNINSAVYLGDTVDDIRAALSAKITPVGVLNDDSSIETKNKLYKSGASLIIDDVNRILEILK